MENLWAPWRSKYLYLRKRKKCILCVEKRSRKPKKINRETMSKDADKKRYILDRSEYSFSMLNIYPYNNGHIMVAPFRHVSDIYLLTEEELGDLMKLVKKMKRALDKKLKPHGYNIGMNIGKAAGAGFDGHLHIHIVPRWEGDTNFMPVVTDVKVVPESLDAMYDLLIK